MTKITKWFLVLFLQIVLQFYKIESKPHTETLDARVLVDEHYLHHSHNVSYNNQSSVPAIVPATIVEHVETFPNGCYKQIIKEADLTDIRRFVETEEFVCPHGISPPNGTLYYAIPPHAPEDSNTNRTHPALPPHSIFEFHNSSIERLPIFPAMTSYPSDSAFFGFSPDGHSAGYSPVLGEVPNTAASDILVISQKIGYYDNEKKSNAANNMNSVNCLAIFVTILISHSFM